MSNFLGAGSTISLNGSLLGSIVSISGPSLEAADVDISNLASPFVWKQFLAGWADAGEVECEVNFDPGTYAVVYANFRIPVTWTITIGLSGASINFTGYVKSLKLDVPLETQVTAPFTIKATGVPSYTA